MRIMNYTISMRLILIRKNDEDGLQINTGIVTKRYRIIRKQELDIAKKKGKIQKKKWNCVFIQERGIN